MRQALYAPSSQRFRGSYGLRPAGRSVPVPAPVGGWDTDTPVRELPPEYTPLIDNWIPKGVSLELRKGYEDHVTGLSNPVETLMPYNAASGAKLFAASDDSIYDATSAGSVGAAVVGSLTSARFSHVNFTTSAATYLWICNGADNPRTWDGSTWATPSLTITTYTDNNIFKVFESKQRLFFLFKDTLTFGYLPVDSVSGTVSNFPLGSIFSRGGTLLDGASFSFDGGGGPDDYTCFLTSEGEVAVYQGSNPGNASDWVLVGVFYAGKPVGDRPFVELGGDLGVITRNGLAQVSQVFRGGAPVETLRYLTGRVSTAWRDRVGVGAAFDGWEGLHYPDGDLLLVNVPLSATTAVQFVRHQVTGGWTRFTAWNFETFALFGGALYAGGSDGGIYKVYDSYDDDGEDIIGAVQTPWSTLGAAGVKTLLMWRPVTTSASVASVRAVGRVDYEDTPSLPNWPSTTTLNAAIWGEGTWGSGKWGGEAAGQDAWRGISGNGHAISLLVEARTNAGAYSLNAIDLMVLGGGPV